MINILCDRVMLGVYAENAKAVEKRHLAGAIREVLPAAQAAAAADGSRGWLWAALAIALLLALAVYLLGTPAWLDIIPSTIPSPSEG